MIFLFRKLFNGVLALALTSMVVSCRGQGASAEGPVLAYPRTFSVKGVITEIKPESKTVIIQHEEIPNYMEAMTMPFHVRTTNEIAGLKRGDVVTFRLSVAEDRSWIDHVRRMAVTNISTATNLATSGETPRPKINIVEGMAAFAFTNEFGQPVNFMDYEGQALGLTFFFTRCPLPDFCPRLSKNFASATRKLKEMANGPTNWHFFSITIDPERDTPPVLLSYGRTYGYDSNRWTFVTGSLATIEEVARRFNFNFKKEGAFYTHQFFTLVLDADGAWHAGWPVGGDTSDNLVAEIVSGAAPKKR